MNAWWGNNVDFGYDLAAHLPEADGNDWLLRRRNLDQGWTLFKAQANTQVGFFFNTFYRFVDELGFPYGENVDQTSLLPT